MIEPQPVAEQPDQAGEPEPRESESKVVTTEDELEAFYVVKSLLRRTVDPKRIIMRDTQSYCGVLLDDNNRKPICRLHFNGKQKYIGLFKADKSEERLPVASADDIYTYTERLKETALAYDAAEAPNKA
jgi:hypothetical protein